MSMVVRTLLAAALAAPLALFAAPAAAAADKAACGNIELVGSGECHFEWSGGCKANCEPLNLTAACDGQCNATIQASCNASCSGTCQADCQVDPGSFSCSGHCAASCGASCEARCQGAGDKAACASYCQADCKHGCDVKCDAVAPTASCDAKCQGSCGGSCDAQANFDCSYACTATMKGGCEVACEQPNGALFCGGQYVHVEDFWGCIAYLESQLQLNISVTGNIGISCATAPTRRAPWDVGGATVAALGLGLVLARRRRS